MSETSVLGFLRWMMGGKRTHLAEMQSSYNDEIRRIQDRRRENEMRIQTVRAQVESVRPPATK